MYFATTEVLPVPICPGINIALPYILVLSEVKGANSLYNTFLITYHCCAEEGTELNLSFSS